ncbi:lysoplasmalogenase-like protein TMEM86A [Daphnia pulicaria]|uniref:lysoplasmalogenase-like protein TMEM86A n=1 Tax=Daphnia pulicaria TaxID=35523 RepID=UPI001EEC9B9F|nr:lysoplasmalogenase-like protein TMEM86A [Daphnia pulicaria]
MTSPKQVLKSIGPKLVPFFKTLAIYFVVFIPEDNPSLLAMFIKCLPVASLLLFVLMHGMSLGNEYTFSRRILIGLMFSCLGDGLLVWRELFLYGMVSFGIGHMFFISAFGFQPLNLSLGIPMYIASMLGLSVWLPQQTLIYKMTVPIYTALLVTMAWRAAARVRFFEDLWTWTKLCSCVGGFFFVISDAIIGFHMFYSPIPYGQVLIMTTYYAAQLGIALSVVDSKASYIREEESRKKKKQQRHLLLNEQEGGSIMAGSAGTDIRHRRIGSVEN